MFRLTSSQVRKMWSIRGGAKPTRPIGRGGGLVFGSRLPTCSMPWTSSITWPLGIVKRIDSPCPGPTSPSAYRVTATPAASSASVYSSRSDACSTFQPMWFRP